MKNMLFPHRFQPIGWVVFLLSVIAGCLRLLDVISLSAVASIAINDAIVIGIVIGALFIVCSRERIEDEMTKSIRLSSLLNSIYVYASILIVCTICINGPKFLYFSIANLVLLPIIFVYIFRLEMHRYNKMSQDEE